MACTPSTHPASSAREVGPAVGIARADGRHVARRSSTNYAEGPEHQRRNYTLYMCHAMTRARVRVAVVVHVQRGDRGALSGRRVAREVDDGRRPLLWPLEPRRQADDGADGDDGGIECGDDLDLFGAHDGVELVDEEVRRALCGSLGVAEDRDVVLDPSFPEVNVGTRRNSIMLSAYQAILAENQCRPRVCRAALLCSPSVTKHPTEIVFSALSTLDHSA